MITDFERLRLDMALQGRLFVHRLRALAIDVSNERAIPIRERRKLLDELYEIANDVEAIMCERRKS